MTTTDQPTKWVPSQEELVSLGFETRGNSFYIGLEKKGITFFRPFIEHSRVLIMFRVEDYNQEPVVMTWAYPKSLEELRLLISMMNP